MDATHRGRAPQICFTKSSMSRAVSFGSIFAGLSSGGDGALTVAHSSTIVWPRTGKARLAPSARIGRAATVLLPRSESGMVVVARSFIDSSLVVGDGPDDVFEGEVLRRQTQGRKAACIASGEETEGAPLAPSARNVRRYFTAKQ